MTKSFDILLLLSKSIRIHCGPFNCPIQYVSNYSAFEQMSKDIWIIPITLFHTNWFFDLFYQI